MENKKKTLDQVAFEITCKATEVLKLDPAKYYGAGIIGDLKNGVRKLLQAKLNERIPGVDGEISQAELDMAANAGMRAIREQVGAKLMTEIQRGLVTGINNALSELSGPSR